MGVLDGIRVVELGLWLAGPVAGGMLADWGAEVVKIEPVDGDPMRRLYGTLSGSSEQRCPPFDTFNRGKRSVGIDLKAEGGLDVLERILETADVFLTNMRPTFLGTVGLGAEQLTARLPRLVYATITGYGLVGPDKDAPGFDVAAFVARSGIAERMQPAGTPPPALPGGMGDVITGMSLVGGIVGALFARERTGRGQVVSASLLRSGVYSIGMDVSAFLGLDRIGSVKTRESVPNPLMNSYPAADGAWFWLIGAESERHWPRLLACLADIGTDEDLGADERFATPRDRRRNAAALVAALDRVFTTRPRDEWAERFAQHDVWWAPVNAVTDLPSDPQVLASGAVADGAGGTRTLATPIDFSDAPLSLARPAPVVGSDTAAVLAEAGMAVDEIERLRQAGVVAVGGDDAD
jgi:crotonobetainyl-CoA:carnitine CoA-transferase CaiB-like acyl-CoA transferase